MAHHASQQDGTSFEVSTIDKKSNGVGYSV
jgi:hypothetical protein